MNMDIYQAILETAPNQTSTAAGDLHEQLWIDLLKQEDPEIHNVRLSRGDRGIDGLKVIDPVLGVVHNYQAKFFPKIGNDNQRKKRITQSFLSVHANPLLCETWTLLVPFKFSSQEIFWLFKDMKIDALILLEKMRDKNILNVADCSCDVQVRRINNCKIKFRDLDDLIELLRRHLDICSKYLPESKFSLLYELQKEKEKNAIIKRDTSSLLMRLQEDNIRRRKVETQRATSAIKMLNQGWANYNGLLKQYLRIKKQPKDYCKLGVEIEAFSQTKEFEAFESEGLLPGISNILGNIHIHSRILQQVSIIEDGQEPKQTLKIADKLFRYIQKLQLQIGDFQRMLYFQSNIREGLYNE